MIISILRARHVVFTIKFKVPYVFPAPERRQHYGTKLFIVYANSVTKRFIYITLFGHELRR